jgi:hypothetical protein
MCNYIIIYYVVVLCHQASYYVPYDVDIPIIFKILYLLLPTNVLLFILIYFLNFL